MKIHEIVALVTQGILLSILLAIFSLAGILLVTGIGYFLLALKGEI